MSRINLSNIKYNNLDEVHQVFLMKQYLFKLGTHNAHWFKFIPTPVITEDSVK